MAVKKEDWTARKPAVPFGFFKRIWRFRVNGAAEIRRVESTLDDSQPLTSEIPVAWKHSQTTAWTVATVAVVVAVLLTLFVASRPWQKAAEPVEPVAPEKPESASCPVEASVNDSSKNLTPEQEKRFSTICYAMQETVDLSSMNKPSYKLGQALSILQDIISLKTKADIKLRVNHNFFPNEATAKKMLNEIEISSNLFRTTDNQLLREVAFKAVLENILSQAELTFRATPEGIEIIPRPDFDNYLTGLRQERVVFFNEAMNQTIDLSSMTQPSYKLRSALSNLQDIINAKMKSKDVRQRLRTLHRGASRGEGIDKAALETDIKLYLNPGIITEPDDAWTTLDKMDISSNVFKTVNQEEFLREVTFKTILGNVLRLAGWTFKITPDYLEIIPLPYFDKYLTPQQRERVEFIQKALKQQMDLTSMEEPTYKIGLALTILQELINPKLEKDIKLHVNPSMFSNPDDVQVMLKESEFNMGLFKKANGGKIPDEIPFEIALDLMLRQVKWTYRVTPDFVEIIPLPHD